MFTQDTHEFINVKKESKIEKDYLENSYHPNDLIHGILSYHCEKNSNLNKKTSIWSNIQLVYHKYKDESDKKLEIDNWKILSDVYWPKKSFIYSFNFSNELNEILVGAIYINDNLDQIVIVFNHSGCLSFLKKHSTKIDDLLSEIYTKISDETYEKYSISFTGFSTGASLAELALVYFHKKKMFKSKAITFNASPNLDYLKEFNQKEPLISLKNLEIISYSNIDTALKPIGIYQLLDTKLYNAMHSLEAILNEFDFITGRAKSFRLQSKSDNINERKIMDLFDRYILILMRQEYTQDFDTKEVILSNCEYENQTLKLKTDSKWSLFDLRDKVRGLLTVHNYTYEKANKAILSYYKLNVNTCLNFKGNYSNDENEWPENEVKLNKLLESNKVIILKSILIEKPNSFLEFYCKNQKCYFISEYDDDQKELAIQSGHQMLFVFTNVTDLNEIINCIDDYDNLRYVITTNHDDLINLNNVNFSWDEILLNVSNDPNNIRTIITSLKQDNLIALETLKTFCLIKNSIDSNQLISYLNSKGQLKFLQSKSLVKFDRVKHLFYVDDLTQKAVFTEFDCSSTFEFLKFISNSIKFKHLDVEKSLKLFLSCDEIKFESDVNQLRVTSREFSDENVFNFLEILIVFLKQNQLNSEDNRTKLIKTTLTNLNHKFERFNGVLLQNSVQKLIKLWNDKAFVFNKENETTLMQIINNLNKFRQSLSWYHQNAISSNDKKNIILIGSTRDGKSTLINGLLENKILSEIVGFSTNLIASSEDEYPEIGNDTSNSKTNIIKEYFCSKFNLNLWDTPGLYDKDGVFREIFNSLNIFYLNDYIDVRKTFSLVLVISSHKIIPEQDNFIKILTELTCLCNISEIRDKLSLVITKNKYEKDQYIELFNNMFKEDKYENIRSILEIFIKNSQRIALVEYIDTSGKVKDEYFNDVKRLIEKLNYGEFKFKNNLSEQSENRIRKLTDILNSYSEILLTKILKTKNTELAKKIFESNYNVKQELRDKYAKLNSKPLEHDDDYLNFLRETIGDDFNLISDIKSVLDFFDQVTNKPNSSHNLDKLCKDIKENNISYTELLAGLSNPKQCQSLELKLPIIYASELKQVVQKYDFDSVKLFCFMFVIDSNLEFNELRGKSLSIMSYVWKILGKNSTVMISLKGDNGERNGEIGYNGGDFYAFGRELINNNNKLVVDVSGGKGGNFGNEKLFDLEGEKSTNSKNIELYEKILYKYQKHEENANNNRIETLDEDYKTIQSKIKEIQENIAKQTEIPRINKLTLELNNKSRLLTDLSNEINYTKLFSCVKEFKSLQEQIRELNDFVSMNDSQTDFDIKHELNLIETNLSNLSLDTSFKDNYQLIERNLNEIMLKLKHLTNPIKKLELTKTNLKDSINDLKIRLDREESKTFLVYDYSKSDSMKLIEMNASQLITKRAEIEENLEKLRVEKQRFEKSSTCLNDFICAHIKTKECKSKLDSQKELFYSAYSRQGVALEVFKELKEIKDMFQLYDVCEANLNRFIANYKKMIDVSWNLNENLGSKQLFGKASLKEFFKNLKKNCKETTNRLDSIIKGIEHSNMESILKSELTSNLKNQIEIAKDLVNHLDDKENQKYNNYTKYNKSIRYSNYLLLIFDIFDHVLEGKTIEEKITSLITKPNILNNATLIKTLETKKRDLIEINENLNLTYKQLNQIEKDISNCRKRILKKRKKQKYEHTQQILSVNDEIQKLIEDHDRLLNIEEVQAKKLLQNDLFLKVNRKLDAVFTNPFLKEYEFNGTFGGKGGNSGSFNLNVSFENLIEKVQKEGEGGENNLNLIGSFYYELCFASLREIKEKGRLKYSVEKKSSKKGSFFINLISSIIMPLSATFSDEWIDGPYKIEHGQADHGSIKQDDLNDYQLLKEYKDYMNEIKNHIKKIYPQFENIFSKA